MATNVQRKKKDKSPSVAMGKKLQALGKAMQQPDVKLGRLAKLAADCGLGIDIKFSKPGTATAATVSAEQHDAEILAGAAFIEACRQAVISVPQPFKTLVLNKVAELVSMLTSKSWTGDVLASAYKQSAVVIQAFRDNLVKQIAEYDKAEKPAVADA